MINVATLISIQQLVWCIAFIIGLEFFLLSFFINEDKLFLLLGASILTLSLMSGMDIWIIFPENLEAVPNKALLLFSIYGYQILATIYLLLAIWMTRFLIGRPLKKIAVYQSLILAIFAVSFLFDACFSKNIFFEWKDNKYESTWIYEFIFSPVCVIIFTQIVFYTIKPIGSEKFSLKQPKSILGFSYCILLVSGIIDFAAMFSPIDFLPNFSNTEIGILSFVFSGTVIFTTKMIEIYSTQQNALLEIEKINATIRLNQPLIFIGESTKKITEEILHQASTLNQYSKNYLNSTAKYGNIEMERIEHARQHLEKYSNRILEFSTCAKLNFKKLLSYGELLLLILPQFPEETRQKIKINEFSDFQFIFDKNKFPIALIEIIQNAVDADATQINIHVKILDKQLVLEIEDDGSGIENENIQKITAPFFTTQKSAGKFGLGANIAKAIIESHGGTISFFPKNLKERHRVIDKSGMTVVVSLPFQFKSTMN